MQLFKYNNLRCVVAKSQVCETAITSTEIQTFHLHIYTTLKSVYNGSE